MGLSRWLADRAAVRHSRSLLLSFLRRPDDWEESSSRRDWGVFDFTLTSAEFGLQITWETKSYSADPRLSTLQIKVGDEDARDVPSHSRRQVWKLARKIRAGVADRKRREAFDEFDAGLADHIIANEQTLRAQDKRRQAALFFDTPRVPTRFSAAEEREVSQLAAPMQERIRSAASLGVIGSTWCDKKIVSYRAESHEYELEDGSRVTFAQVEAEQKRPWLRAPVNVPVGWAAMR